MSRFRNTSGKELMTNAAYSAWLKGAEHYLQCGRALTLPPDIRALHPRPSSASRASDPGTRTDDDMQPLTSQHTPWLASLGSGWAQSESDDLGAPGCARTRTSMQAQWATTYRRPPDARRNPSRFTGSKGTTCSLPNCLFTRST
ncbi:hypothetical protein PIB30_028419 [Stylosanthes scabra]|uniref:Uncharacterized protein n=1 Tax=Stylosanthes scabra TaxID=79078 RepID=A0ABU6VBU5_9FABA|nr:hypothetical protein [Stylosanthes scabra]